MLVKLGHKLLGAQKIRIGLQIKLGLLLLLGQRKKCLDFGLLVA
jgi:hypothetical protein